MDIVISYSSDMKTLRIVKNGRDVLTVTRKNAFNGSVTFRDVKNRTSTADIKVIPLPNNEYKLIIKDTKTSETFYVTSKINPLADYEFSNKNSLKKGNNRQVPDALVYYLVTGTMPDFASVLSGFLAGLAGGYVEEVYKYLTENWDDLMYLYSFYGFWRTVIAVATAPKLAGIISVALAATIVS